MSRESQMRDGSSIVATKAIAVSWPTPEKVISRRQTAGAVAMHRMPESIVATVAITVLRVAIPAWRRRDPQLLRSL